MPDLASLIDTWGYWAVLIGAFLEGETILALAGFASHRGYLDFTWVVVIALLAGFAGDQFYFFLGRFHGAAILARHPELQGRAHRFDEMLARWHAPLIVGIRFMYGFRIVGPILLGMGRVPAWKFMFYNFIGAAIWAPLVAGVGYLFGEALHRILSDLHRFEAWGFAALVALGVGAWAWHRWREKRAERAEAARR